MDKARSILPDAGHPVFSKFQPLPLGSRFSFPFVRSNCCHLYPKRRTEEELAGPQMVELHCGHSDASGTLSLSHFICPFSQYFTVSFLSLLCIITSPTFFFYLRDTVRGVFSFLLSSICVLMCLFFMWSPLLQSQVPLWGQKQMKLKLLEWTRDGGHQIS